jgi:formate/nitrite transporter FocA (FNT family)
MYAATIAGFADQSAAQAASIRRSPIELFVGAMLASAYIRIALFLALSAAEELCET